MELGMESLEKSVMAMLLAGDDAVLGILRQQFDASWIANREFSGAGFFTTYGVPAASPLTPSKRNFSFGDVGAVMDGVRDGVGFVLHVKDGLISCLEGYTYDEPWPETISSFSLSYLTGDKRDMGALCKKWT